MMQSWQQKILGSLDLLFLFSRGLQAFAGERRQAIRTCIGIEIILFPLLPITAAMVPPVGMEAQSYLRILLTTLAHYAITLGVGLAVHWQIVGWLGKRDRFWLVLESSAWCSLVFVGLVMLPVLGLDAAQLVPPAVLQRVYLVLTCYQFVVSGCILAAAYRVNIWLIIGWTMGGIFIDRESWNLLYALQGLPLLP
jgi:hypothetical protein